MEQQTWGKVRFARKKITANDSCLANDDTAVVVAVGLYVPAVRVCLSPSCAFTNAAREKLNTKTRFEHRDSP